MREKVKLYLTIDQNLPKTTKKEAKIKISPKNL